MSTQLCIATGQPLANLIALLHFKPQKVIVVATKSMKQNAKNFKKILNDLGIESIYMVDGCPDTDLAKISEFLKEKVLPELPDESCIFNLTGGTKLHSFSMYEVFKARHQDDKFIYVDTNNRLIEHYPTTNQASFNELLPSVLNAQMTLKGMGKKFITAESGEDDWVDEVLKSEELTYFIANNITDDNVKQLIGDLNGIIGKLYNGGKSFTLNPKQGELHKSPKGLARELLEKAHDLGLITWHAGNGDKKVSFDCYAQARYLSGIWLEEYVWLVASKIDFEEVYSGLRFGNQADNEIDLFIQHQNMALAIECKSATSTRNSDVSQDMFHKLTGVANRASGSLCQKLFVSAFALKTKNGNDLPSVNHAREQDIKIVQAQDIVERLPKLLESWKEKGRLTLK
ncbi:Card1-like endonuclease domain-containing protein [Moraxella bovoculi]|uniref:Card1-like endonuclease domain-containing protein n=1 Tax=Moraxella bovoculi TaxID=386891 RepID=UPI003F4F3FF2